MAYIKETDGTILDMSGKVLMFSIERFKNDIVFGDCCFICGASSTVKKFNAEHILPNWLLGKFSLHSRKITLPNLKEKKYGEYTLPCCEECNTLMGNYFEKPISEAISKGADSLIELYKSKGDTGTQFLTNWLALIFIKSHLKDAKFRAELDTRKNDLRSIGEKFYNYEYLHHIHCLARSFYTNAHWGKDVQGSIFLAQAKIMDGVESFDFADSYDSESIFLRIDDFFIIAVFNDSFRVINYHVGEHYLSAILKSDESLTILQIRELFARINHCAQSIDGWPLFHSEVNAKGEYQISARFSGTWKFLECNSDSLGKMIWHWCGPTLEKLGISEQERSKVLSGKNTFLLDVDGNFKKDSLIPK